MSSQRTKGPIPNTQKMANMSPTSTLYPLFVIFGSLLGFTCHVCHAQKSGLFRPAISGYIRILDNFSRCMVVKSGKRLINSTSPILNVAKDEFEPPLNIRNPFGAWVEAIKARCSKSSFVFPTSQRQAKVTRLGKTGLNDMKLSRLNACGASCGMRVNSSTVLQYFGDKKLLSVAERHAALSQFPRKSQNVWHF